MGGESGMKYMLGKLGEKEGEMGEVEKWMNYVMDKLKELLVVLEDFVGSLIAKLDEVFPRWLLVATPFLIAAAVLLIICLCCRCCCCCRRGRGERMMRAPGRDYMMPRSTFESNPRSYFRDLRGRPLLEELV